MIQIDLENKKDKGVYTLIMNLAKGINLKVGCLGSLKFKKGWYVYTGSALGSGGLVGRVQRHLKKDKKCFWHIDYFLESKYSSIKVVIYAKSNKKYECKIIKEITNLNAKPIKGFGASDCKEACKSHLYYMMNDLNDIVKKILDAYNNLGLNANFYFLDNKK
ncbi:MAG: GIY-YIG nuclease family protein [Nitrososphaerales archaeon]